MKYYDVVVRFFYDASLPLKRIFGVSHAFEN